MANTEPNAPELTVDQALQNVAMVCARTQGNLQDHQVIQASLQLITTTLREAMETHVESIEPNRAARRAVKS